MADDGGRMTAEHPTYSLAEIRDGTGWPRGVRFTVATYECMNCGVVRTYGPEEWISCEDELGRSCRRRIADRIDGTP